MIAERVRAGMARAKERGTKSGKPIGRPAVPEAKRIAIRDAYMVRGLSLRALATKFAVGHETVRRCLRG
jgi:DNA invertase Pin-like site-specific DNA recombinase